MEAVKVTRGRYIPPRITKDGIGHNVNMAVTQLLPGSTDYVISELEPTR